MREITLLGQNVNAYHGAGPDGADWTLARLIRELAGIDGLLRLRFTTSHPNDMSDDLIAAHGEVTKLMPWPRPTCASSIASAPHVRISS